MSNNEIHSFRAIVYRCWIHMYNISVIKSFRLSRWFHGNTPCPYQSYGRNWTLICDCRKESCNVTMWSMQGKIFKFRIINRLSKLNRWMEYMYIMKIFVETTVPTQMTSYYLSSRAIPLLTTLKVVYETSNVYNATYPDNVDIMHFPKHIWLFCLK